MANICYEKCKKKSQNFPYELKEIRFIPMGVFCIACNSIKCLLLVFITLIIFIIIIIILINYIIFNFSSPTEHSSGYGTKSPRQTRADIRQRLTVLHRQGQPQKLHHSLTETVTMATYGNISLYYYLIILCLLLPDSLYKCNLIFFIVLWNSKNGPCSRTVDWSVDSTYSLACSEVIIQLTKRLFI